MPVARYDFWLSVGPVGYLNIRRGMPAQVDRRDHPWPLTVTARYSLSCLTAPTRYAVAILRAVLNGLEFVVPKAVSARKRPKFHLHVAVVENSLNRANLPVEIIAG